VARANGISKSERERAGAPRVPFRNQYQLPCRRARFSGLRRVDNAARLHCTAVSRRPRLRSEPPPCWEAPGSRYTNGRFHVLGGVELACFGDIPSSTLSLDIRKPCCSLIHNITTSR